MFLNMSLHMPSGIQNISLIFVCSLNGKRKAGKMKWERENKSWVANHKPNNRGQSQVPHLYPALEWYILRETGTTRIQSDDASLWAPQGIHLHPPTPLIIIILLLVPLILRLGLCAHQFYFRYRISHRPSHRQRWRTRKSRRICPSFAHHNHFRFKKIKTLKEMRERRLSFAFLQTVSLPGIGNERHCIIIIIIRIEIWGWIFLKL